MTIELGDGALLTGLLILASVFEVLAVIELRRARSGARTNALRHRALVRFVGWQGSVGVALAAAVGVWVSPPWQLPAAVLLLVGGAAITVAARLSYTAWLGSRTRSRATLQQFFAHQVRRLQRFYASADGFHEHQLRAAKGRPWLGRLIAFGCVVGTLLLVELLSEVRTMASQPDDAEFTSTLLTKIATVWVGSLIICATPVVFLSWVIVAGLLNGRPSVRMILRRASDAIGSCTAFGLLAGALVVGWNVAGFADPSVTPSIAVDWILDLSIGGVVVGFGVAHFTTLDEISRSTPNRILGWLGTLATVYLIALITTTRIWPAKVALVLVEGATDGVLVPADVDLLTPSQATDWQLVLAASKFELSGQLPSAAAYAVGFTVLLGLLFLASFRSWSHHRDRFAAAVEPGRVAGRASRTQQVAASAAVAITYLAFAAGISSAPASRWGPFDTALLFVCWISGSALLILGVTAGVWAIIDRRVRQPDWWRRGALVVGLVAEAVLLPTVAITLARHASESDLSGWGGISPFRILGWLIVLLVAAAAARYLRRRTVSEPAGTP